MRTIQVPNSQIFNGVVENFTLNPLRRVEVFVMTSTASSVSDTRAALEVWSALCMYVRVCAYMRVCICIYVFFKSSALCMPCAHARVFVLCTCFHVRCLMLCSHTESAEALRVHHSCCGLHNQHLLPTCTDAVRTYRKR